MDEGAAAGRSASGDQDGSRTSVIVSSGDQDGSSADVSQSVCQVQQSTSKKQKLPFSAVHKEFEPLKEVWNAR